jgi:AcrR family transcriptional regulator
VTEQVTEATPKRSRPRVRERKKASNRAALLAAARAVFAEMGFGAASVRDIVRRTDLATGTFYNYFEDKDAIFAAVVGEITDELLRRHRQARTKATTAEEFMRRHFEVYLGFIAEDPELVALAQRNVTAIRTLFDKPDVRALHRALIEDLREAMAKGVLPTLDVYYLAAAMGGIAFEISLVMVSRTPVDAAEAARFAAQLALAGVNAMKC